MINSLVELIVAERSKQSVLDANKVLKPPRVENTEDASISSTSSWKLYDC
jgi:hypothetical protein